jgi:Tol biopolymer transport system component
VTIPADRVREQLERMLACGIFQGAARASTLLRFVVEETLAGRSDRLKDYTLGAEALGRGDDFDPRTDPIARVEASRLRSRLELYYATEGAADPVVITLPKGGYVPAFAEHVSANPEPADRLRDTAVELPPTSFRGYWPVALGISLVAATALILSLGRLETPTGREASARELVTPGTTDPTSLAIAPDDSAVVVVGSDGGVPRLWQRPRDGWEWTPLEGTEYASLPFWSDDATRIGFFAGTRVKYLELTTDTVTDITVVAVPAGAAWSREGAVLFPMTPDSPLFLARPGDRHPAPVTTLGHGHTGHRAPHFLPDGRRFVFLVVGAPDVRGIYLGDTQTSEIQRLFASDGPAQFARGHLFYTDQRRLLARAFDPDDPSDDGPPQLVSADVASSERSGIPAFSVSRVGTIVFRAGRGGRRHLVRVDGEGRVIEQIEAPESRGPYYPALSPDGYRLLVQRTHGGNTDIHRIELSTGLSTRVTDDPQPDIAPLWVTDTEFVYSSQDVTVLPGGVAGRVFNLYRRPLNDARSQLVESAVSKQATDICRRHGTVLFRTFDGEELGNIWAKPAQGEPFRVRGTGHDERDAQFSPDCELIAYQSDERDGRFEVYVQPFPSGEPKRVSGGGGGHPRWSSDGSRLYYIAPDSSLVVVPITKAPEAEVAVGAAQPLFFAHVGTVASVNLPSYLVVNNGQRFILDQTIEEAAPPLRYLEGWKP